MREARSSSASTAAARRRSSCWSTATATSSPRTKGRPRDHLQVGIDGVRERAGRWARRAVPPGGHRRQRRHPRLLRSARLRRGQRGADAARRPAGAAARPSPLPLRQRHGLRLGRLARRRGRHQHRRRHRLDRLWRAPGQGRARRRLGRDLRRRRLRLLDRGAGPEHLHPHERRPPAEGAALRRVQSVIRPERPISTSAARS